MTDPTKAMCDSCGREGRVFALHHIKLGSRHVLWRECAACQKAADERAIAACAQAEKARVA